MPLKDNLYNGRKGIGFENPSYFEKAKDLRPTLYDEKVIGLGYTPMFLTHSNEALEIEKFKRSRENKIEFAYDYGNLNASYVNENINFKDDYFKEIINPDFEKIDSLFHSELENQNKNDCFVVEKECDKEENPKVIAPGMFKLSVSQRVPISMSKSSRESSNVEIKLKRKRHLDTSSSVRRPKNSGVIWKKKGSSNTSNIAFVGKFCDKGLEVAFRKSTCFVRSKDGVDLLTGDRLLNLYTIALNEVASNSSTNLLAKASSLQSWLWHQRLSHLNFAIINNLVKNNLVQG
nr:integrase, catalytic region, zinc finger, CCHC-type, peptidase aspartic, catalytic [Tanacetum cinerariifolium]